MSDEPKTWHYGLIAQMWAISKPELPELAFLRDAIKAYGQPVLDVACGTGRLLIPLLKEGIDIEGCDISSDMLEHCRTKLGEEGLSTALYEQAMHALELPHIYQMVYIADSFGLSGDRKLDEMTFNCLYRHLAPGGVLIFNKEAPYCLDDWQYWPTEKRQALPESWPEEGKRRIADDGTEYTSWIRQTDLNPLEQTYELEIRVEKRQGGRLLAEEERSLRGTLYFRNELVAMLEKAGFRDVSVYGGYTHNLATADDENLLYVALK